MVDDHKILCSGSRNTLTYICHSMFKPPDHVQCRLSLPFPHLLLREWQCTSSNPISHPWRVCSIYLGSQRDRKLHLPEMRPHSTVRLPTPNTAFLFSRTTSHTADRATKFTGDLPTSLHLNLSHSTFGKLDRRRPIAFLFSPHLLLRECQ